MSRILVYGVRIPAIRRVLAWLGWPRPQDFDRMPPHVFEAYMKAVGLDAAITAALAERNVERKGESDQSRAVSRVRTPEERAHRRRGAPVA